MIENKENELSDSKTHRRRGGAFDTVARVLRAVGELVFRSGVIMRNRIGVRSASELNDPSTFVDSESVFEIYHQNSPQSGKYNLIYLGRNGKGIHRNTNYIELSANIVSGDNSGIGNGRVLVTLSRDGVDTGSYISVNDARLDGLPEGVRINVLAQGSGNGVQISYADANGNVVYAIAVDEDGIQMAGLPTSAGATGSLYNDGGTIKIA